MRHLQEEDKERAELGLSVPALRFAGGQELHFQGIRKNQVEEGQVAAPAGFLGAPASWHGGHRAVDEGDGAIESEELQHHSPAPDLQRQADDLGQHHSADPKSVHVGDHSLGT